MRLLILGGTGMLGHKLLQACQSDFETWATVRGRCMPHAGLLEPARTVTDVNGADPDALAAAMARVRPDAVINAIGIVKQRPEAKDPVQSLTVNSLLPHRVAGLCAISGARFIHVSTDCVFSGRKGRYVETDQPDAEDLYGRTKHLGEVIAPRCLTIRTSIIGRELAGGASLVEWFLAQRGRPVPAFTHARFSGLTTIALSRIIVRLLREHPELTGLYHVAAEPISKHDLLAQLQNAFDLPVRLEPRSEPAIDRTLDGSRFRHATGLAAPSWPEMIAELAADPTPYEAWRA
jgi:dTDP-4-dehydrorhamnose reductase